MTKINTYFSLLGTDFDPRMILDATGLIPTATWRAGDAVAFEVKGKTVESLIRRRQDGWEIKRTESRSSSDEIVDVETSVQSMLDELVPHKTSLLAVKRQLNLGARFSCAIYTTVDRIPVVYFEAGTIAAMAEFEAEFEIDLMIWTDES
ncbi:MAG: DUF4279 domain-containing protein [Rhodothermales bacterium]